MAALHIITGPAQSGKTDFAVKKCLQLLGANRPVTVLLPTQSLVEAFQNKILESSEGGGTLSLYTHTFFSFIKQTVRFTGFDMEELSTAQLHIVLQSYLSTHVAEYPHLCTYDITPGLVEAILGYFSDLADGGIPPEEVSHLAEHEEIPPRVNDLHRLYGDFTRLLTGQGFVFRELLFQLLANNPDEWAPRFVGKTLIVDGFYDLTPVQKSLLEQIFPYCHSTYVTLLTGVATVFEYSHATLDWLEAWQSELGGEDFTLSIVSADSIQDAEKLFQVGEVSDSNRLPELHLWMSQQQEIEGVTREVKRLILQEEITPGEIAVIYRSGHEYRDLMTDALQREGVPVAMENSRSLLTNPAVQSLLRWFDVLHSGFSRPDVLRWLRSHYVEPKALSTESNIELLTAVSLDARIYSGRQQWITRIRQHLHMMQSDRLENHNEEKTARYKYTTASIEDLLDAVKKVWNRLPSTKKASLGEHIEDLHTVMDITGIEWKISSGKGIPTGLEARDIRAWQQFMELLNDLKTIEYHFATRELSTAEFYRELRDILSNEHYLHEIKGDQGVEVVTVEESRGHHWACVFVVGVLDDLFPVQQRSHPLVKLWERQRVNSLLSEGYRVIEHQAELSEERLLFYIAMTRGEQVRVSTVTGQEETIPSPFVDEVRRLYRLEAPKRSDTVALEDPWLKKEILSYLVHCVDIPQWEVGPDSVHLRHIRSVEALRDGSEFSRYDGRISKPELRRMLKDHLKGEKASVSPSQIEVFNTSPFQYLARYLFRIKELEDVLDELGPDERGLLLHQIMERFCRTFGDSVTETTLPDAMNTLGEISADVLSRYAQKGLSLPGLLWEQEQRLIRAMTRNTVRYFATHQDWLDLELDPDEFEFSFGTDTEESHPPFDLDLGDETIQMRGRADRLDVNKSTGNFSVLDYKTSSGKSPKDFREGKALQLQVYAMAARELLPGYLRPVRLSYYLFKKNKEDGYQALEKHGFDSLWDVAVEQIGSAVERIQSGEFFPVEGECDRYCPVKMICRCEANRIRAKNR